MHPVIAQYGKIVIHSYGLMLALSFLLGIWWASRRARKAGLDTAVISDIGFWVIFSAVVGARLYYVGLHFEEFRGNLGAIFNPFHGDSLGIGGLVMYGGLIGAVIAGLVFFRIRKLPFLPYADAVAPAVGIGIFFTRIGCFLNGCCYGKPTDGAFGCHFPVQSPAGYYQSTMHATHLVPSQLFESIGGLAIALIVLFIGTKTVVNGLQFYTMVVLYSILRFMVDFTRYYSADEKVASLSHNQIVCIVIFIIFTGLILKNIIFRQEDRERLPGEQPSSPSG